MREESRSRDPPEQGCLSSSVHLEQLRRLSVRRTPWTIKDVWPNFLYGSRESGGRASSMGVAYILGVYVFLAGCLLFTADGLSDKPVRKLYVAGALLFDIGCVFFALDAHGVL